MFVKENQIEHLQLRCIFSTLCFKNLKSTFFKASYATQGCIYLIKYSKMKPAMSEVNSKYQFSIFILGALAFILTESKVGESGWDQERY